MLMFDWHKDRLFWHTIVCVCVCVCARVCVCCLSIMFSEAPRKILLCRMFFPHDLDSAADALLAGDNSS